ncbi:MAG: transporter substrate-binding domain-containing protein [Clostridia bacterium]|nr:transporter substrate-binding domain-containing protein [Clostridia bacterium]
MKKKVLITLLVMAIVGVSCMAFAGCSSKVKIGFQSGTTGQFYTEDLGNVQPVQYPNATLAVQDMINGRIGYVITDIAPAKAIAAKFADKVKVIDYGLTEEQYCFAINPKDTKGIKEKLNKFMKDHDAELKALQNAYVQGTNEKKVIYSAKNPTNPLTVATSPDFPPFENVSGDGFEGYDLEVMDMFCKEYGFDLVINSMDFDSIVLNVGNGQSDVGAAALTWSEERAESVTFSDAYYDATQVVICLKSDTTFDNCKSAKDVEAKLAAL